MMTQERLTVAIVHYNTPKLTTRCILSLFKHTPGCRVVVMDNSDKLPFASTLPDVEVIDNTGGQVVDFREMLAQYPDREDGCRNRSGYGSAKHTRSVDVLTDILTDGFILMDSDVLIRRDVTPLADRDMAAVGDIWKGGCGIPPRLRPFLCWINVPVLREHGIRYFNGEKMWALSHRSPDNRYDTGAWLYEACLEQQLPVRHIDHKDYCLHFGHGSWKQKKSWRQWTDEHRQLWDGEGCP